MQSQARKFSVFSSFKTGLLVANFHYQSFQKFSLQNMTLHIFTLYVLALSFASAAPQTVVPNEDCMLNFVWLIDEHRLSKDFDGHCVLPGHPNECTLGVSFDVHCWKSMKNHIFPLYLCLLTSEWPTDNIVAPCCLNQIPCGERNEGLCSNVNKPCTQGAYKELVSRSISQRQNADKVYSDLYNCPNRLDEQGNNEVACCYPFSAANQVEIEGKYNMADAGDVGYAVAGFVNSVENNQIADFANGEAGSGEEDFGGERYGGETMNEKSFFNIWFLINGINHGLGRCLSRSMRYARLVKIFSKQGQTNQSRKITRGLMLSLGLIELGGSLEIDFYTIRQKGINILA